MSLLTAILVSWVSAIIAVLVHSKIVVFVSYFITNPLIILALYAISRYPSIRSFCSREWYRMLNRLIIVILLLNAPGSIYLHDLGIQYDRFLHFTAVFVFYLAFMVFLAPFYARKHPKKELQTKRIARDVFVFVFIGLFAWEATQWIVDAFFGTQLYHDAVQSITRDVVEDILFGAVGLLFARMYVLRSKTFFSKLIHSLKEQRVGIEGDPAKPE